MPEFCRLLQIRKQVGISQRLLPAGTGQATPRQITLQNLGIISLKQSQPDQVATQLEVKGCPEGSFQVKHATGTFSSQPQQGCSVRYMAQPQQLPFLPCLSHHSRSSCYHTWVLTEAGQDMSGCCSYTDDIPRALLTRPHHAKEIRKSCREKVDPRQRAGLGSLRKGTISAPQPQHQSITHSWEL